MKMDRLVQLGHWLDSLYPEGGLELAPASADASFRRYFRVSVPGAIPGTVIVMDAPPDHEDCGPFVKVAKLLSDAGLHAPRVLAQDLAQGFLLLTDLGDRTYLAALDERTADPLYGDAIDALVRWQLASRPDVLPPYDAALLGRELELFPEWYVGRHLGIELSGAQRESLARTFALLIAAATAQSKVYVHRDYMPRNLMVATPNPGILDFQDAVEGPITYDVASLFKHAFLSWPEERVLDWSIRYWEKARRAGLPVSADFGAFYRDLEWMGLQRHLKVLGIFARLKHRDGKEDYVQDTPRFVAYVRAACARYTALGPLLRLFDELGERAPQAGYTF
jgi:aminoglycoside/choline kinase family phosphotransferase